MVVFPPALINITVLVMHAAEAMTLVILKVPTVYFTICIVIGPMAMPPSLQLEASEKMVAKQRVCKHAVSTQFFGETVSKLRCWLHFDSDLQAVASSRLRQQSQELVLVQNHTSKKASSMAYYGSHLSRVLRRVPSRRPVGYHSSAHVSDIQKLRKSPKEQGFRPID
jgi:hypothetical protein